MSEPTEQDPTSDVDGKETVQDTDANTEDKTTGEGKKPWGDGEFDADKAWNLIQNLRHESSEKGAKLKAYEDEKLTASQKADRDLKEAREQLAQVQRDKAYAQARADHPMLTDADMQFIGSGTPEEIADRAAKLAERLGKQDAGSTHVNPVLRANPTGGTDPTSHRSKDPLRDMLNNR